MAEIPAFGQREALKALQTLGFMIDTASGKGSHAKAKHPTKRPMPDSHQRPLMTIPHRREYGSHARKEFVKQIMAFGFTKEEVLKALRGR